MFLFPSFREGLPVAVMEAMASGLPVIATRIRGTRDLIQEGILFDPTDVDGIAKSIKKIQLCKKKYEMTVYDNYEIMKSMNEIYEY